MAVAKQEATRVCMIKVESEVWLCLFQRYILVKADCLKLDWLKKKKCGDMCVQTIYFEKQRYRNIKI